MQGEQGLGSGDVQNKDTETSPAVTGLCRPSISACHTRKVWATLLTDGVNARAFYHREVKEPTPSLTNCARQTKLKSLHPRKSQGADNAVHPCALWGPQEVIKQDANDIR